MSRLTASELDGMVVTITDRGHALCGFIGIAMDRHQYGLIDVHLDYMDPTDDRVAESLRPDQVEIYRKGKAH